MEQLQLAQMLADLSDLRAADPRNAEALVRANKPGESVATATTTKEEVVVAAAHTHSSAATATAASMASLESSEPASTADRRSSHAHAVARPDHRRVSSASNLARANGTSSPLEAYMSRLLSPAASFPSTPRGDDADLERTNSVMALYELRHKLKQYNDSTSLRQARDKVAALSARQQQSSSASTPTSPSTDGQNRRHSQYTYPRS